MKIINKVQGSRFDNQDGNEVFSIVDTEGNILADIYDESLVSLLLENTDLFEKE